MVSAPAQSWPYLLHPAACRRTGTATVTLSAPAATGLGLVAVLLWSTTVGVTRSVIEALGPTGAPAVMFSLAAVLLWPARTPIAALPRRYLWLGAATFVGYELCFVLALGLARTRHETIEVSMVNYLWPSLTVLLAMLIARRGISWMALAGLALATAGVVAASSPPQGLSFTRFFDSAAANPLCFGLAFVGAVVWAVYSNATRALAEGRNGLWLFMTLSALAFWIVHALHPDPAPMRWSPQVLLLVGLSSAAVTLAYLLWNLGVLTGNVRLLGLAANTTPLMSALFASLLMQAPLSPTFWTGAGLVALGSLLAGLGGSRPQAGARR